MSALEAVVQRLFDAIDANDHEALREVFSDDIRYERPRYAPLVGIDDVVRFYRDDRPIVSGAHAIAHIIVDAEKGAAWGTFRGKTRAGGDVDVKWADVFELDARGRICWRRSHLFEATEKL